LYAGEGWFESSDYPFRDQPFGCVNEDFSCAYPQITQITQNLCNLWIALEVQLQPKLELPRVEGGGGAAEVAAVVRALVERPHVVDKW
jgi:hypothetical protein